MGGGMSMQGAYGGGMAGSAGAMGSTSSMCAGGGMGMGSGMGGKGVIGQGSQENTANSAGTGLRFPLSMRRPPGLGPDSTPAARFQMQQSQHELRVMQQNSAAQWGSGSQMGMPGGCKGMGMRPQGMGMRPPAPPPAPPGTAGVGAAATPKFPAALQSWLQRLFAHQSTSGQSDPLLQKQTHVYLRNWVQQWVKTGELWQRNWEIATLPTPDEIRRNLAPGTLSGRGPDGIPASGSALDAQRPKASGAAPSQLPQGQGFSRSFPGLAGFGGPSKGSLGSSYKSRSRSRSRGGGRDWRAARRQRSNSSSSQSRSRSRRRSRSRGGKEDWDKRRDSKGKGKGGKDKGKDKDGEEKELREKVRSFLNQKIDASYGRAKQKDLQDDLQYEFNVNPKKFRTLFQQTLAQYMTAYSTGGADAAWPGDGKGPVTQGEADMRSQRANRFQAHLNGDKAAVAMVSFNDGEPAWDGGPIVGELNDMCSREEAKEREMTRQLDKFEWKKGTDAKTAEVNLALATRKYQRSSADKAYKGSSVRSLKACWRTMEYLMTEILDFDVNPKPAYAIQSAQFIDIYSYLRDRTRSVRVDLHLQQPTSTTHQVFAESHECCLRFEMLSLYLLIGKGVATTTEKYDTKLGLKAISQTIEPLLNCYQAIRDKLLVKSILAEAMGGFDLDDADAEPDYSSPWEMSSRRFIILLLMTFSPEGLMSHLSKLSREILSHPLVNFATQVYAAFQTDNYARFLRLYRDADFLSAVAMSGVADLARVRTLWLLVRTYPQPIGDKLPLANLKNMLAFASDDHAKSFLAFHGLQIVIDPAAEGGAYIIFPKRGTPEAAQLILLEGTKLPEKCDFPKGADSMLVAKYQALACSRADIVFGSADPMVEVAPEPLEEPMEPLGEPMEPVGEQLEAVGEEEELEGGQLGDALQEQLDHSPQEQPDPAGTGTTETTDKTEERGANETPELAKDEGSQQKPGSGETARPDGES